MTIGKCGEASLPSAILGMTFPKYLHWYQLGILNDWGRFGEEPERMAEAFKPDEIGPKWSEN